MDNKNNNRIEPIIKGLFSNTKQVRVPWITQWNLKITMYGRFINIKYYLSVYILLMLSLLILLGYKHPLSLVTPNWFYLSAVFFVSLLLTILLIPITFHMFKEKTIRHYLATLTKNFNKLFHTEQR